MSCEYQMTGHRNIFHRFESSSYGVLKYPPSKKQLLVVYRGVSVLCQVKEGKCSTITVINANLK